MCTEGEGIPGTKNMGAGEGEVQPVYCSGRLKGSQRRVEEANIGWGRDRKDPKQSLK